MESSKHQMFIIQLNVHSECRTSHFTTSNFRPAGLNFMVEHTTRTPTHGCCWVGQHQAEIGWLGIGWDVSEKLVYQPGLICPYALLKCNNMAKIWPYYFNNLESLIGHQEFDKYYSVFAPGTLGILPDTYLVPVINNGLGERHIKNATMGFINVTERNHWMTFDTAFIHINTSLHSTLSSQNTWHCISHGISHITSPFISI